MIQSFIEKDSFWKQISKSQAKLKHMRVQGKNERKINERVTNMINEEKHQVR